MATVLTPTKGFMADPRLDPNAAEHKEYVRYITETEIHNREASMEIWQKALDYWDLFLAIEEDDRDPVDEAWRSNVFVPLPFSTTRTKAAMITEVLGNTEPVWQVEAIREEGDWYEQSRHYERLLDYAARQNKWRKFLYKSMTSRSVQGTTFAKIVWSKRAHTVTLQSTEADWARYEKATSTAIMMGAPDPNLPPFNGDIEAWREVVNKAKRFGRIPAAPVDGSREIVEYEGPILQQLPLWSVRVDPMIDEMANQRVIIHRMVKPLSYILNRADDDPNSDKPYLKANVDAAMSGWDGQILENEEQELADSLGINSMRESHPYYAKAVELWEVWSPEEPYQYTVVMNRKAVINKKCFERPLLTSTPNIFALRNIIVPGHFYGLSDYQEPEKLFIELNRFRRLRQDGATLSTLPAFGVQRGVNFSEAMRKIRPGALIPVPVAGAIQSLIQHQNPPEAYREPQEIKLEIEDAVEVYSSTKGAPATVGRVTGTEFQGRSSQIQLKYKVDASMVEEEWADMPLVMLSFFAQMGPEHIHKAVGGDPDAIVDVSRDQLVEAMNMRFRFRGAVKNIQPDLQVQQLTTALREFQDVLSPTERRAALQLVLGILDVRGYSKILTDEGMAQVAQMAQSAQGAEQAQNGAVQAQAEQAQVPVPPTIDANTASAM